MRALAEAVVMALATPTAEAEAEKALEDRVPVAVRALRAIPFCATIPTFYHASVRFESEACDISRGQLLQRRHREPSVYRESVGGGEVRFRSKRKLKRTTRHSSTHWGDRPPRT